MLVAFRHVSRLWGEGDHTIVMIGSQQISKGYIRRPFALASQALLAGPGDSPFPALTSQRGDLLFNIDMIRASGEWTPGMFGDSYTEQKGLIMPATQIVRIFPAKADKVILRRAEGYCDGYVDMNFTSFMEKLKARQNLAP